MSQDGTTATPRREEAPPYPWSRLFYSAFFLVMLWLSLWAMVVIAIIQLVVRSFDRDGSDDLREFSSRLGTYLGELADYLGMSRETPPFPFARFPNA